MSDTTTEAAGAATAAIMKADHERWLTGLAQWRNDIQRWQAEHRAAIARLAEVQHAIDEHGRCLDDHAIEFGRIEEAVASHECLMDGEAGGTASRRPSSAAMKMPTAASPIITTP